MTRFEVESIITKAGKAASTATEKWLDEAIKAGPKFSVHSGSILGNELGPKIGEMLDACGNSWIRVKDGRTKFAKIIRGILNEDNPRVAITVPLRYTHFYRQEYGLHCAATRAAMEVFNEHGIKGLTIYSYID